MAPGVVDIRLAVDVELEQPALAEDEQQFVEVGRVVVDDLEDIARHQRLVVAPGVDGAEAQKRSVMIHGVR